MDKRAQVCVGYPFVDTAVVDLQPVAALVVGGIPHDGIPDVLGSKR